MQTEIVAIAVGFISALVTSILGSWLGYRTLRAEYLGKRNIEFINKQLVACESLWIVLESGSRSKGTERVIVHKNEQAYLHLSPAINLYDSLNKVFNSASGLYYSKKLRDELFDLRNFIMDELISKIKEGQTEIQISNNKAKEFDSKVQQLRIAIRAEIGVNDLKVTNEGPINKL